MNVNRTHVAGIAAVALLAAYGRFRWRGAPDDADEQAPTTERRTPAAD